MGSFGGTCSLWRTILDIWDQVKREAHSDESQLKHGARGKIMSVFWVYVDFDLHATRDHGIS